MKTFLYATLYATFAGFVILLCSDYARADAQAGQDYFTLMGTYIDDDDLSKLDDGVRGGQFGFGRALNNVVNVEAYLAMATLDGFPGQDQTGLGTDLQFVINRDGRFSPYLFLGAGYLTIDFDGGGDLDGLMMATGVGFLADVFGDSNVALRGEYRIRRHGLLDTRDITDRMYSLGFQFPFGGNEPVVQDSDGDGVLNVSDRCPGTRAGAAVDQYGCETDADNDGVVNAADRCPDTPPGTRVGGDGCPADSDHDGVSDTQDQCPNTVSGAAVDRRGCELDSDSDEVVDRLDQCPGTEAGVQVDINGCEIKEEIRLPGVNFETNSDRLVPGAESVLNDAAATLQKNPEITVEVAGYTDSDGAAEYNEGLSERRAETVRDYLADQGVAGNRMTVRGYGESAPIADNGSREGKAANRRVVLRIVQR